MNQIWTKAIILCKLQLLKMPNATSTDEKDLDFLLETLEENIY